MVRIQIDEHGRVHLPDELLAALGAQRGHFLIASGTPESIVLVAEPHELIDATYGLARDLYAACGGAAAFITEVEESWRG